MKLIITNIKGLKFAGKDGYYMASANTWAFKTEKGFYSDDSVYPYTPAGGKKALQLILDGGGFLNYDGVTFVQPMEV